MRGLLKGNTKMVYDLITKTWYDEENSWHDAMREDME
jgi:hypothetical protein